MDSSQVPSPGRREFLKLAGTTAILAGISPRELFAEAALSSERTAIGRLVAEPFSFAVLGDFGAGNASPKPPFPQMPYPNPDCLAVSELIHETTPPSASRYIMCVGDMCYLPLKGDNPYPGTPETIPIEDVSIYDEVIGQFYHAYIRFPRSSTSQYARFGADRQRFYFVLGDHDWWHMPRQEVGGKPYFRLNVARFPAPIQTQPEYFLGNRDTNPFFEYFGPQDGSRRGSSLRYYQLEKGAVHWIALSSDANETLLGTLDNAYYKPDILPNGSTPGDRNLRHSVQGRWFRKVTARPKRGFRFVVTHYPPYTSSSAEPPYDGHPSATYMRWGYENFGVDAVFSGHVHAYERLYVNGVTYITCGGGGTFESLASFLSPPLDGSMVRVPLRFGFLGALEKRGKIFFHYVAAQTPTTKGSTSIQDRFVFLNRGILSKRDEIKDQRTIHVTSGGGIISLNDFDIVLGNVLAGTGRLRKSGVRQLQFADGNSHFSGILEIRRGEVYLRSNFSLNNVVKLELHGGTLGLGADVRQHFDTPLLVRRFSTLYFENGSELVFAASGTERWPARAILILAGEPGPLALRVGTDRHGLRRAQLEAIRFGSVDGPSATMTETGYVVPA